MSERPSLMEQLGLIRKDAPPATASAPTTAPAPEQCPCGAHLAGECPDCDDHEPSILSRLHALGDSKGVNPPTGKKTVDSESGPDEGAQENQGQTAPEAKPGPTTSPDKNETCPKCGKSFKHLSRHRNCKGPAVDLPKPSPKLDAQAPLLADGPSGPTSDAVKIAALEKVASDLNAITIKQRDEIESLKATNANLIASNEGLRRKINEGSLPQDDEPEPGFFILLLDCLEHHDLDAEVFDFAVLVEPLAQAVARENKVPHWKCVEYGNGPGLLAAKVERLLEAKRPSGFLRASSADLETLACLSVLKRFAKNIIQGVR